MIFENSFRPNVVPRNVFITPFKMGTPEKIVSFIKLSIAIFSFYLQLSESYLIYLSQTLNIIFMSYILCQLLDVNHGHPCKI